MSTTTETYDFDLRTTQTTEMESSILGRLKQQEITQKLSNKLENGLNTFTISTPIGSEFNLIIATAYTQEKYIFDVNWIRSSFYSYNYSKNFIFTFFFILNLVVSHTFIEIVIRTLLNSIVDVAKFLDKSDKILNLQTNTAMNFEEVNNLVEEILYYFHLVQFIKT